jgi:hypothetical protein
MTRWAPAAAVLSVFVVLLLGTARAAPPTVVRLRLDPTPGVERALRHDWEALLGRLAGGDEGLPEAPLPPAVFQSAPEPRLTLPLTRARDAWAWQRALDRALERAAAGKGWAGAVRGPALRVSASPPEQAAVGPDVPATLAITFVDPAAAADARGRALEGTRGLVVRRLQAAAGVEQVREEPGGTDESLALRVDAPSLAADALAAAVARALPRRAGGRLQVVEVLPGERARAALEEALAALEVTRPTPPEGLQAGRGPGRSAELLRADAETAAAIARQPRRRPAERLVPLAVPPGSGRQGFVLVPAAGLVDLTFDVLGADTDLGSDFQSIVHVHLGKVSSRRLADLAGERTGAWIALVHDGEALAVRKAGPELARGYVALTPSSQRGPAAEERAAEWAAALRDVPAGATVTLEGMTATAQSP